jgi:hypothetical protein
MEGPVLHPLAINQAPRYQSGPSLSIRPLAINQLTTNLSVAP